MPAPIIRSFDTLERAQAARDALIEQGVAAEAIEVRPIHDEAGPVEGNFYIGNGRSGGPDLPSAGVLGGGEVPYARNFAETVTRGTNLLILTLADSSQAASLEATLDRSGGVNPDPAAAPLARAGELDVPGGTP